MSALLDRIDRFVRWFFNSSPTAMEIEPTDPPVKPVAPRQSLRPARLPRRRQERGHDRNPAPHRTGGQLRGRFVA